MGYSWLAKIGGAGRADAQGEIASSIVQERNGTNSDSLEEAVSGIQNYNGTQGVGSGVDTIANMKGLSAATKDYLVQYYLNGLLSKEAFDREYFADSTKYQRAVADLQKAGVNPFMVLQGLGPGNVGSSSGSVSGSNYTNEKAAQREQQNAVLRVLGLVVSMVGASIFGLVGKTASAGIYASTRRFHR